MRLTLWTSAVYSLGLLLLVFFIGLLYKEAILHSVTRWNTLGGSHAPLIFAVSLYLIWLIRDQIRNTHLDPALFSGGLLLVMGCFALFAGKISSTILVQQISLVPVLLGLILLLGGFGLGKLFVLPVGYLIFLTDFLDHFLGEFSLYFQQITAWLSALFLKLLGFSVFHNDITIMLSHITMVVAPECSGINQMVALLALAVPLAYMTQKTLTRKIILVSSSLIIALFANGMRAAMIGVYALYSDNANLHGPAGTLSAQVIFLVGLVLLILFSVVLSRTSSRKNNPNNENTPEHDGTASSGSAGKKASLPKIWVSLLAAAIVLGGTYGLVYSYNIKYTGPEKPLHLFPKQIAGFAASEVDNLHKQIRPFPADKELMRRYKDGQGNSVTVYIGYLGLQNRQKKLIDYRRTWMHERLSKVEISTGNAALEINKTQLQGHSNGADIYFWYQMGDRIIRNEYVGKFVTFVHALVYGENSGAVVVLQVNGDEQRIQEFLSRAVPRIHDLLSSS